MNFIKVFDQLRELMNSQALRVPIPFISSSDLEQSRIRLFISSFAVVWSLFIHALEFEVSASPIPMYLFVSISYLLIGLIYTASWRRLYSYAIPPERHIFFLRITCLLTDVLALSAFVAFSDIGAMLLLPVYFSEIIGYGMRYGRPYLSLAMFSSIVSFFVAARSNSYLREMHLIIVPHIVAMGILPTYVLTLLQRYSVVLEAHVTTSTECTSYLAATTHEIRTPLQAISHLVDDARSCFRQMSGEGQNFTDLRTVLEKLQLCADRLLSVANRISIQRGRALRRDKSATDSLTNVYEDLLVSLAVFTSVSERLGVCFRWSVDSEIPAMIDVNCAALQDILINLLDNAAKASKDGEIDLSISRRILKGHDHLFIRVIDSGKTQFAPRASTAHDSVVVSDSFLERGGAGLGLIIVKSEIRESGGTIEVATGDTGGTEVRVSLPIVHSNEIEFSEVRWKFCVVVSNCPISECHLKAFHGARLFVQNISPDQLTKASEILQRVSIVFIHESLSGSDRRQVREKVRAICPGLTPVALLTECSGSPDLDLDEANFLVDISASNAPLQLLKFRRLGEKEQLPCISSNDVTPSLRVTVLVIEDSEVTAIAIQAILIKEGYRVVVATTLDAAKSSLLTTSFDIIVADLYVGNSSLLESDLITQGFFEGKRWLLLSGDGDFAIRAAAISLGAIRVLQKPVTSSILLDEINQAIRASSNAEEISLKRASSAKGMESIFNELVSSYRTPGEVLKILDRAKEEIAADLQSAHFLFTQRQNLQCDRALHKVSGVLQFLSLGAVSEFLELVREKAKENRLSHQDFRVAILTVSDDAFRCIGDLAREISSAFTPTDARRTAHL